MKAAYQIFGKRTLVDTTGFKSGGLLHNELSLYPKLESSQPVDLRINYIQQIDGHLPTESRNPSSHESLDHGFNAVMGAVKVQFLLEAGSLKQINFCFNQKENSFWQSLRKLKDIQFLTDQEAVGQIFHELILVPAVFFDPSLSLVHASGISTTEHKTILFGGTGGVGKTSLELELCQRKNCTFFADDICPVSHDGMAYPNLAYPKVYAYNVKGNQALKKKLFAGRSIVDRVQWELMSKRGLDKVRRRLSPLDLYGRISSNESKLSHYIILGKENVERLDLETISPGLAAKLNAKVMHSEYGIFFNHIHWHEYNKYFVDKPPLITWPQLIDYLERNFQQALEGCEIWKLKIPLEMNHRDFVQQTVDLIDAEIGF